MNIAQALKEKNRSAGRVGKLQKQVQKYNQYDKDKQLDFVSTDLLMQLQTEWAHLIDLKVRIARANIGIADKLVKLAEAKSALSFWADMAAYSSQSESVSEREVYVKGQYVSVLTTRISTITSKEVLSEQEKAQTLIDTLQDEIDTHNGTTQI